MGIEDQPVSRIRGEEQGCLRLYTQRQSHFHDWPPRQLSMEHSKLISCYCLSLLFLFTLLCFPVAIADLTSEKQALLNFFSSIPHARRLKWDPTTPICSSWVGITCTPDGTHVLALRLPGIGLFGQIPSNTISKLEALQTLSLRSNLLSGIVPSDISSLPSLEYLFLQNNNFSGNVPSSLSPVLKVLDLSFNSLAGNLPPTIQNLTQLTGLSLQSNNLTGPVPDLNLPKLKHLNLSYNDLNGSIPLSLGKFPNSSFEGNSRLCGPPLERCFPISPSPPHTPSLPPREHHGSKKKPGTGAIIVIAVGGAALLIFLTLVMLVCCLKKRNREGSHVLKGKGVSGGRNEKPKEDFGSGVQEAEKNKLVFFEGCSFNFDLEDLLRASAGVLGKGSYGTAYKAALEDGTNVVVKRLKEVVVGKKEFEQKMETVGRVRQHPNVVPLRAYYYSKDEKLLVYDYISAGSLSTLLHAPLSNQQPAMCPSVLNGVNFHNAMQNPNFTQTYARQMSFHQMQTAQSMNIYGYGSQIAQHSPKIGVPSRSTTPCHGGAPTNSTPSSKLVYEFIENGNLSQHLRGTAEKEPLSWSTRVQIALDSTRGLEYIHDHTVPVYIHRDIKSANILIDKNYHGKVADFGLTKLTEVGSTSLLTRLVGTFGYMPPEYAQYGDVSPKVDVYAFGVVLT